VRFEVELEPSRERQQQIADHVLERVRAMHASMSA
jgi:hypothetical protein